MRFSVSYTFAMEEIKFGELKLVIVLLIAVNLRRSRRNVPIIVCRGDWVSRYIKGFMPLYGILIVLFYCYSMLGIRAVL